MIGLLRGVSSLVWDLGEALISVVFDCGSTERLWDEAKTAADRLADKEAEDEVAEPGRGGGNDAGDGTESSSGAILESPPRDQDNSSLWSLMTPEERKACLAADYEHMRRQQSAMPCTAALSIADADYRCDQPYPHTSWAHRNRAAEAYWEGPQPSSASAEESPASGSSAAKVSEPPSCVGLAGNRVTERKPDAGQPNLTADELDFASFAIRRYADSRSTRQDELYAIADKLDPN